jgi:NADPH:quinone reductase-like Zn-dependent oxidoreductase
MSANTAFPKKAAWLVAAKTEPLEVGPAPAPIPKGTEVVIQVHSAAINPADAAIQKLGIVVQANQYPYMLGNDIVGIVSAIGPNNTRFKPGDRVTAVCIFY